MSLQRCGANWIACGLDCSLRLIQSAYFHLVAENLLGNFGQVAEIGGQFAQFLVVLLAVELPEPSPFLCWVVPHDEQYSAGLKSEPPIANRLPDSCLAKGTPADVGEHGSADDQERDRERRDDTGPEADATERDEESVLMAGERDSCLVGQQSPNGYRYEKPSRPHNGKSERKLKGLIHGNCPLSQRATE